jgi:hypothetical protein
VHQSTAATENIAKLVNTRNRRQVAKSETEKQIVPMEAAFGSDALNTATENETIIPIRIAFALNQL